MDIINKTDKAYFNCEDINRIENNIEFIYENLSKFKILNSVISKSWTMFDLPDYGDIRRLYSNINYLSQTMSENKIIFSESMEYQKINELEKLINDTYELLCSLSGVIRYCDDASLGCIIDFISL